MQLEMFCIIKKTEYGKQLKRWNQVKEKKHMRGNINISTSSLSLFPFWLGFIKNENLECCKIF